MHEHADNFENSYKKMKFSFLRYGMKFSKLRYGKFIKIFKTSRRCRGIKIARLFCPT